MQYTSWEDEPPEAKEAYDKAQQAAADAAMDVDSSRSAATPGAAGEGYAQHQQVPQPGAGVPPPPTRGLPGLPVNPYEDDAKQVKCDGTYCFHGVCISTGLTCHKCSSRFQIQGNR